MTRPVPLLVTILETTPSGAHIPAAPHRIPTRGCASAGLHPWEAAEVGFPFLLFGRSSDENVGVKKCLVGKVNREKANK